MSTVDLARGTADPQPLAATKSHHTQLTVSLAAHVEALVEAAAQADLLSAAVASTDLVHWCDTELIPHVLAEKRATYPPAHLNPYSKLLVDALLADNRDLVALVQAIRQAKGPVRAAANAHALQSLFASHLVKEKKQILALLAASSEVSLADILAGKPEPLGDLEDVDSSEPVAECGCGGECGCGHQHPVAGPLELDA